MKEIVVNGQIVILNNVKASAELTPSLVRSALRVMYGNTKQSAIVSDKTKAYRVTPRTIRRLTAEEEYDLGLTL